MTEKTEKSDIKPRVIAFEITRKCRYACKHCRANAGECEKEKELTTGQCEKILASIAKYNKCMVIVTGGEPMERKDIYDIIRYGTKLGLRMVMATCGYLVDMEALKKLKEAGLMALSFSLDGAGADTHDVFRQAEGAFDYVIRAAELAKKAHLPFQINTVISKTNVAEIVAIAELVEKIGAYCFNPFILVPTGRGTDIADEILDKIEYDEMLNELLRMKLESKIKIRVTCGPQFAMLCKKEKVEQLGGIVEGCIGGRGFGFISYEGDVQTCGFLDKSAGNIVKSRYNFAKIWEKSEFLNEIRNVSEYSGKCRICEFGEVCGGCRARAYAMNDDYLAADPVCSYKPRGK